MRVGDVAVNAVGMTMAMVVTVMVVVIMPVMMVMIVIMAMPARRFFVIRVAELSVMVVDIHLTFRQPIFEGGHQVG